MDKRTGGCSGGCRVDKNENNYEEKKMKKYMVILLNLLLIGSIYISTPKEKKEVVKKNIAEEAREGRNIEIGIKYKKGLCVIGNEKTKVTVYIDGNEVGEMECNNTKVFHGKVEDGKHTLKIIRDTKDIDIYNFNVNKEVKNIGFEYKIHGMLKITDLKITDFPEKISNTAYVELNKTIKEEKYVIQNSSTEYLKKDDIKNLTNEELGLAINEIYARHGRIFDDEYYKKYFESCSWYKGSVKAEDFDESVFNKYEKANIDLLASYREKSSGEGKEEKYILKDSSKRYLEESDIKNLTNEELGLAINEIYARHGRIFDDKYHKKYFESCSWYKGSVKAEDFDESVFNEYEKANIDLLASYRKKSLGEGKEEKYILKDSSKRYLGESDIKNLTNEELGLAINEIYARHGRIFDDEYHKKYFESCSWYKGSVKAEDFDESVFNEYEKANIDLLASYRNK